jgi:MFS family permease
LAGYQIAMRTGWIFKTESVIMPAVLDFVAGAGWVRGLLPLLNRFGHSIPPLLLARRVKNAPYKKWIFCLTTTLIATLMLAMASLFSFTEQPIAWWVPPVFLVFYTMFFVCIGVNHLAFNTLQGKLVATTRRGRLLLFANVVGATTAVLCAFFLLPLWLNAERPRFDLLFAMAGGMFAVSALLAALLVERPDNYHEPTTSVSRVLVDTGMLLRRNVQFRRLAFVGSMFGTSMMLFPHYQSIGLQEMQLDLKNLMWWVVIQNIGTGLFSVPAGILADRRGNRIVLQIALLGIAAAPIVALVLRLANVGGWYCLVFPLVGLTPVVIRTLQNFTLEICEPADHPRYLSTMALCVSLPLFLSPLVGLLIDLIGFEIVFIGICVIVLIGWLMTLRLREPRHHVNVSFLQTSD